MNLRANARVFGWCPNYLSMDATVASSSALTTQVFEDPYELARTAMPQKVDTRRYLNRDPESKAIFSRAYDKDIDGPVDSEGKPLYVDDFDAYQQLTLREICRWQGHLGNEKFNFFFDAPRYEIQEINLCINAGGFYTGQLLQFLIYRAEMGLLDREFNIGGYWGNSLIFLKTNPQYSGKQLNSTEYAKGLNSIHAATRGNKQKRMVLMTEYNKPFVDSLNKTLTGVEEVRVQVQQLPAA